MELDRGSGIADAHASDPPARASLFRRDAVSATELFVQTFAVVLGILLALAVAKP